MPFQDGYGPMGQGPLTGRGLGPCGKGRVCRGFNRRMMGWFRGFGRSYSNYNGPTATADDLEAEKKYLQDEIKAIDEEIKSIKKKN